MHGVQPLEAHRPRRPGPKRASRSPDGRAEASPLCAGPLEAVRGVLESYARRGVLRSLSESEGTFRFHWLWNAPFVLKVDGESLVFRGLLSSEPALAKDVRQWLVAASSETVAAHRRLDKQLLTATYARGTLKFRLRGDFTDGAKRAIQLVNELFVVFLSERHPEYLRERFQVGED